MKPAVSILISPDDWALLTHLVYHQRQLSRELSKDSETSRPPALPELSSGLRRQVFGMELISDLLERQRIGGAASLQPDSGNVN